MVPPPVNEVPPLNEIVVELGTAASQAASEENSTTLACAALEEIRPRKMDDATKLL